MNGLSLRFYKLVFDRLNLNNFLAVILLVGLAGCNLNQTISSTTTPQPSAFATKSTTALIPETTPLVTPSAAPDRLLTICLGREPASLFYYDALSRSAQDVLAAIYDGPVDIQNAVPRPVILEKLPTFADGDALLKPVEVTKGDLVVDNDGNLVNLDAGVSYRPTGCSASTCAQAYPGDGKVQMDQLVLHFKLLSGIQWSDGTPLTSSDSVYSYQLARSLYPSAEATLINLTAAYTSLDENTVEWVGVPGFQDGMVQDKFFTPLPQHAWNAFSAQEIRTADATVRKPLGWGPYVIDEWVAGDHITLHKNPLYFRAAQGLPLFDHLVYRFVDNADEAMDAILAGECDLADWTAPLNAQTTRMSELQQAGKIKVYFENDAGWEQITFGIKPLDNQRPQFFASKEVRQAVAMCIDRKALVAGLPQGDQLLMDSYLPSSNPLYNPQVRHYDFDPSQASALLEAAGWLDADHNPATPRIAQGVQGVPDGTSFEVQYLVSPNTQEQADAKAIQSSLQTCGIQTHIVTQEFKDFLAPGPDGPVFGRSFDLAQFAWVSSLVPPCNLFLTNEIPGLYPDTPKGWGGANASGYSNPEYDQACQKARMSSTDSTEQFQAQAIFAEDLPALPLYAHYNAIISRPDSCSIAGPSALDSALWFLEDLDYGSRCVE